LDSQEAGYASPNPSESLPSLGIFGLKKEKGNKRISFKRKREDRKKGTQRKQ
jgi:hypothetical protein